MTKQIMTRALMIVGLFVAGTVATFAQQQVYVKSEVRRVALDKVDQQPVAASVVAMQASNLNLTADQRAKIASISTQAAALHTERARLWSEYTAMKNSPSFTEAQAKNEAEPRMRRIVAINAELARMVASQDSQVAAILTPSQRASLGQAVMQMKAQF